MSRRLALSCCQWAHLRDLNLQVLDTLALVESQVLHQVAGHCRALVVPETCSETLVPRLEARVLLLLPLQCVHLLVDLTLQAALLFFA